MTQEIIEGFASRARAGVHEQARHGPQQPGRALRAQAALLGAADVRHLVRAAAPARAQAHHNGRLLAAALSRRQACRRERLSARQLGAHAASGSGWQRQTLLQRPLWLGPRAQKCACFGVADAEGAYGLGSVRAVTGRS